MSSQYEERSQPQAVERYASHRGYPFLKPPHTTKQALTRVRDRVQDHESYYGLDRYSESTRIECISDPQRYSAGMDMRSGGTTSNTDRFTGTLQGVDTRDTGSDMRQRYPSGIPSTHSASRTLLGRDGQPYVGHQTMKIVEDWLLAFWQTYLVRSEAWNHTRGRSFCSWKTDRSR